MEENEVLLIIVSFFFGFKGSGFSLSVVIILCLLSFLLCYWYWILGFCLVNVWVIVVKGIRLLLVLIDFSLCIIGMVLVLRNLRKCLISLMWIFDFFCSRMLVCRVIVVWVCFGLIGLFVFVVRKESKLFCEVVVFWGEMVIFDMFLKFVVIL